MNILSALTILTLVVYGRSVVSPEPLTGNVEPAPDPTVCQDNSGTYFVFCKLGATGYHPIRC